MADVLVAPAATDAPGRREPLVYPSMPVDGLLREAARRWPGRTAIRFSDGTGAVTFAELDAQVDRVAAALRALLGPDGSVCGVATALDPAYARAFYAVSRSGNAVVSLNGFQPTAAIVRALRASGARAAIVTPQLRERLAPELPDLPLLDMTTVDGAAGPPPPGAGPDQLACIHFTSGTTGIPKGVRLSHYNLVVNALQTGQAHGLDEASVVLNHLPAYHLMHLNAGVAAGATQVLCRVDDPVEAIVHAGRSGATHYYSLPVRLARLAADPRLAGLAPGTLRGLFSGGSALAAGAGAALRQHFGIPVIQGFGLAETTSMTHLDRPDRPKPGSAGPPAADTDCRIVDIDSRTPLPAGSTGEIEVRGPQLMLGYLDGAPALTADGWLPTGDVGYVDGDGYLFLVDRLKDVFKYDNEMVAPSELERVLAAQPGVAGCAVVDLPDPIHGARPHALVVLACPTPAAADLGAIVRATNTQLAEYQWIRSATVVSAIPRSPIGKIDRRALRAQAAETGEEPTWSL